MSPGLETKPLRRGKAVYIRPLRPSDEDELLHLVRSSRRLHRPWVYLPTEKTMLRSYMATKRRDDFVSIAVCRREDGVVVGVVNVGRIERGFLQSAYLGYYSRAGYEGRGYMTEAMELVMSYAFTDLKLHRLEANVQPGNGRSIALVERCGFRYEGFARRYLKVGGRWRDHERWAVTVEDWRAMRRSGGTK